MNFTHPLIVVAMESEEQALLQGRAATALRLGTRTVVTARRLSLPRCQATVARSGVGLANAAVLLSLLAEHVPVDAVILLGVGGALDPSLQMGDVVVARQVIQHDSVASRPEGTVFIAPGELTLSRAADNQVDPVMACDEVLRRWILEAMKESHAGRCVEGTVLSGSEFAASAERKAALRRLAPDALLVDMEAAAFAQIARRMGIPFVVAKTVADRAAPEAGVSEDYKKFLAAAAAHSRGVMDQLLKAFA